jgi:hypothetical protein
VIEKKNLNGKAMKSNLKAVNCKCAGINLNKKAKRSFCKSN